MRLVAVLTCAPLLFIPMTLRAQAGDDIGVYRAVLADSACNGLGRRAGDNVLVIHRNTQSLKARWWLPVRGGEPNMEITKWFPQARAGGVEAFLTANEREKELPRAILTAPGVTATDEAALQALEKTGRFWERFYKRYPAATGIIRLGAVTVQPDNDEVLAYCGRQSAPLGGEGYLFLLSRGSVGWTVTARRLLWES